MDETKIYRLGDEISFRQCTLSCENSISYGNCTNFGESERNWTTYYSCNQYGIHLHCTKHPEIEFSFKNSNLSGPLICPKCNKEIEIDSFNKIMKQCL